MFKNVSGLINGLWKRKVDWPAYQLPIKSFAIDVKEIEQEKGKIVKLKLSANTRLPAGLFEQFPKLGKQLDYSNNKGYPDLFVIESYSYPLDIKDQITSWLVAAGWNLVEHSQLECKSFSVSHRPDEPNRVHFNCSNTGGSFSAPFQLDGFEGSDELLCSYPLQWSFSVPKSHLAAARQHMLERSWVEYSL